MSKRRRAQREAEEREAAERHLREADSLDRRARGSTCAAAAVARHDGTRYCRTPPCAAA